MIDGDYYFIFKSFIVNKQFEERNDENGIKNSLEVFKQTKKTAAINTVLMVFWIISRLYLRCDWGP